MATAVGRRRVLVLGPSVRDVTDLLRYLVRDKDRLPVLPVLAFLAGISIPGVLVALNSGTGPIFHIWGEMLTPTALLTLMVFHRASHRGPRVQQHVSYSWLGQTLVSFIGAFVASGLAVLVALLPIPYWLTVAVGLCVIALFWFTVADDIKNKHE
jgi:hypothetical protein